MSGLERCLNAQEPVFEQVFDELQSGRKRTHWMWFVFPQLVGLGRSPTARLYSIQNLGKSQADLAHRILGPRLEQCTEILNKLPGSSAYAIFGSPDDLKLRSSVTLFNVANPRISAFEAALEKYFGGEPDARTIALLGDPRPGNPSSGD